MFSPKATMFVILDVALMIIAPSVNAQETTQAQREARYTRYLLKLYLMLKIFSTVLIFRLPNIISFPEKSANPITNGQFIGKMITLIQGKLIFFTI